MRRGDKKERAFFLSYRDAAALSRDCLGFVKCALAEWRRMAQLLFSAAVALRSATLGSPEQFVPRLLLFQITKPQRKDSLR